jgi:hypothetical protein
VRMLSDAEIAAVAESAVHYRQFWEAYLAKGVGLYRK